jgi:hypothetical protein
MSELKAIARKALLLLGRDPDGHEGYGVRNSGSCWRHGTSEEALARGELRSLTLEELVAIIDATISNRENND